MPSALIADDEPHLAEYLRAQLATAWPQLAIVDVVGNGPAAAAAITRHRPDIAFLDIRMPGATGLDVARALSGPARPRVVFVTAYDQYAIEAFEADAVDYLLKPVAAERLARTLEKLRVQLAQPQTGRRLVSAALATGAAAGGRRNRCAGSAPASARRRRGH